MAKEIEKMSADVEVVSKLSDQPNRDDGLTAEELKAVFDRGPALLKSYVNDTLVPAINNLVQKVRGMEEDTDQDITQVVQDIEGLLRQLNELAERTEQNFGDVNGEVANLAQSIGQNVSQVNQAINDLEGRTNEGFTQVSQDHNDLVQQVSDLGENTNKTLFHMLDMCSDLSGRVVELEKDSKSGLVCMVEIPWEVEVGLTLHLAASQFNRAPVVGDVFTAICDTFYTILQVERVDGDRVEAKAVASVALGGVKTVNGIAPDLNGNVEVEVGGSGTVVASVEPAEDDIPKVFFGGALQQTKDEKVVPFRYISKTEDISGYAEIKSQGSSSMMYAKKNQTVKLFKDAACTEKLKVDFKGWGKQNKHCYKANWIDLSHARNVVSARLWGDIVKSRANYAELPELLRTSPNQGAIDGFPVKVYAAGVYQGRYTINIPKDKWMANMDDELDTHCILCGETNGDDRALFRAAPTINGSDWSDEIHDTVPKAIKERWTEVIDFVVNSTDEEFKANLDNYFYVDSLIDYHLFGLANCGLDAYGKNQLYMTYDGQKWIATEYDLDSTWGLWWDGSKFVATNYDRSEYQDFKDGNGNLLYIRLEQLFSVELMTRWVELKKGALSLENIINRFERFTDIASAELVKEDYATTTASGAFTGIPSKTTNNIQQIRDFAVARSAWVDEYLGSIVYIPCTGISLSASTLTFTAEGTKTLIATVYPEACSENVSWESNDTSIATVKNGVVTAVANGIAIITARCGSYSASCSVSVSGIATPVPCTGVTLSVESLSFADKNEQTITATVTPNDTTDKLVWTSSNTVVATVDNGIITPVGDGDCTITATCGNYSASCAVSVKIPVDYTLDALSGVEWVTDAQPDNNTGVLKPYTGTGVYTTAEFTVQNSRYLFTPTSGISEASLYIWDADGVYVGCMSILNIPVLLRSGYRYRIKVYNPSGFDTATATFKPQKVTAGNTVSIDLSTLDWKMTTNTKAEVSAAAYISGTNNLQSANMIVCTSLMGINNNPGELILFMWGTTLITTKFTSIDDLNAYFTEHPTTLVFNP